jgi:UDP-N-acetylglucosamine--dolichyl-phosphate N-acetylglucosaminephosphotransferase
MATPHISTIPPLLIEITVASAVTFLTTPILIKKLKKHKITGPDVHKHGKPQIAEMGGLAVILGFTTAVIAALPLLPYGTTNPDLPPIIAATSTVLLTALVGVYDDLKNLRQLHKVCLLLLCASPLIWVFRNQTSIHIPFIGNITIGILYPLIFIPLAISIAGNLTNMLAGFNGLEAGVGSIALATITITALIFGETSATIITLPMLIALAAFLKYNWYPAKVFPGDVGTLTLGVTIASAAILGGIEILCTLTLIPHILDFFIKLIGALRRGIVPFSQRKIYGDTTVLNDGILAPPAYPSLTNILIKRRRMREKDIVKTVLYIESLFCILTIILAFSIHFTT